MPVDEWVDVPNEWQDVAPTPPNASEDSIAGRFVRAIPGGVGSGLKGMIDPRTYIGAAKTAYRAYTRPGEVPGMISDTARGLYDTATDSPESAGRLTGELATGAIPFGGVLSKMKLAERAASALGYSRAGRIRNISRAVSAAPEDVAALTRLEPGIDLPIAGHKGLERTLSRRVETTGQRVEAAEAALPVTDIPIGDITSKIDSPGVSMQRMDPVTGGYKDVTVTSDPTLRSSIEGRRA